MSLFPKQVQIPRWRMRDSTQAKLALTVKTFPELVKAVEDLDRQHNDEFKKDLNGDDGASIAIPLIARAVEAEINDRLTQPTVDKAKEAERIKTETVNLTDEIRNNWQSIEWIEYRTKPEQIAAWARKEFNLPDAPPEAPTGKRGRKATKDPFAGLSALLAKL